VAVALLGRLIVHGPKLETILYVAVRPHDKRAVVSHRRIPRANTAENATNSRGVPINFECGWRPASWVQRGFLDSQFLDQCPYPVDRKLVVDRCRYPLVLLDLLVEFLALVAHRGSTFVPL
jgi:hypothetical protein